MQDLQSPPLSTERQSTHQKQLKEAFQQLYKQKLIQIKKFYEKQNESLKQIIQSVYKRILADQLLVTMIGDKTTSTYIQQRIQELFVQIVSNERQIIIEKLGIQLNEVKFYYNETIRKYQKLKQEFDKNVSNSYKQKLVNQQKKNELNEQLRKLYQQSYKQTLKIKSLEQELDEKSSLLKSLKMENQILNQDLEKVDQHMSKAIQQSNIRFTQKTFQINSYQQLAKSLQKKLQEAQNNYIKVKESLQKKYQLKINQYKLKIEQYKQKMTQILQQSGININNNQKVSKSQYQCNLERQWELKMGKILRDHQKNIQNIKNQNMIQKDQLEKIYQNKIKDIQTHYQKQLQKKIKEVHEEANQYWKQIKNKETFIKSTIQNYQENYLKKQEHFNILKERQDLIISMKEKIDQDDLQIDQKSNIINQMQKIINNLKTQNDSQVKKQNQNFQLINQLKNKLKIVEQAAGALRNVQKKTKNQLQTSKLQSQKVSKSNEQLKKKIVQINTIIQQNTWQIKQKDKKIKDLNLMTQQLQRKCKDLQSQLQISIRNSTDFQTKFQESKQQISSLQYKCKEIQHKYLLQTSQYDYKNKNMIQSLQSKAQQAQQWQKKLKSLQTQFISLKSTSTQINGLNQKLQLELKYCKQLEINSKEDYQLQINELKNRIVEKTSQLVKTKQQYQSQISNKKQEIQKYIVKCKHMGQKLNQNRMMIQKLEKVLIKNNDSMRKELDGILSYCKNMGVLINNQIKTNYRLLQNQITQCQRSMFYSRNQTTLNLKQQFSLQKQRIFNQFRQNQILKQKQFQQRIANVQTTYKQQIIERQLRFTQSCDKIKYLESLAYNNKEQIIRLNRDIQTIQNKRQKEVEEHNQVVHSLKSQYQNDRNCIVAQYQEKSNLTHQQIQELLIQIQKIKIQTESLKSHHQQQKKGLSSQLRTVQEQEQQVLSVISRKDFQLQKMHEQLNRLLESKNQIQSQLKEIWEQNQEKIFKLQQIGYSNQQLSQSLQLAKSKIDRLEQQNIELQTQFKEKCSHQQQILKAKTKAELQLKELRQAIDRNDKFRDIRALQQMTLQTQQLTNKVNQMKKMGEYLQNQNKRCLRS